MTNNTITIKKTLRTFSESKWFDLVGVLLVVTIAINSGYLATKLSTFVHWGSWTDYVPFGIISVFNVSISMLSTRFTSKLNRFGNYLGITNTVLSGVIDFILGNKAAIITYPITFLIYTFAIKKWNESQSHRPNQLSKAKTQQLLIILIPTTLLFSYITTLIGYQGHMNTLAYVTMIIFALSLIANVFNALKVTTQWYFWLIYNVIQFFKAFTQGNFANVGKYLFYIINSLGAMILWKNNE